MHQGKIINAKMLRIDSEGLVLETTDEDAIEIYAKPSLEFPFFEGKILKLFVWLRDREGKWWGSLKMPSIKLDEVEFLTLADESPVGFFFEWGLEKNLFCPISHTLGVVKAGMVLPVRLVLDDVTNRLMATMKWKKYTELAGEEFYRSLEVDILVMEPWELGYSVLVNNNFIGMVYENQTFKPLRTGQKLKAFVNKVREDGRLDIILQRPGYGEIDSASEELFQALEKAGGKILLGDKSPADLIYSQLNMSKKTFKKSLGALYRAGRIEMNETSFWKVEEVID
jgi:predicted RNA-binding protein (virulence factor B family)